MVFFFSVYSTLEKAVGRTDLSSEAEAGSAGEQPARNSLIQRQ